MDKKYDGKNIRYMASAEYGDKLGRPHYHFCLFNHDWKDKKILYGSSLRRWQNHFKKGEIHTLYKSKDLSDIWGKGFVTVGELTFESAGYVARYCMKKIYGEMAPGHYQGKTPEFALISKGIGKEWYRRFKSDVYPKDFTTLNGRRIKTPIYYDYLLEKDDPEFAEEIKRLRRERGDDFDLRVEEAKSRTRREKYKKIITKQLQRIYENGKIDDD